MIPERLHTRAARLGYTIEITDQGILLSGEKLFTCKTVSEVAEMLSELEKEIL